MFNNGLIKRFGVLEANNFGVPLFLPRPGLPPEPPSKEDTHYYNFFKKAFVNKNLKSKFGTFKMCCYDNRTFNDNILLSNQLTKFKGVNLMKVLNLNLIFR